MSAIMRRSKRTTTSRSKPQADKKPDNLKHTEAGSLDLSETEVSKAEQSVSVERSDQKETPHSRTGRGLSARSSTVRQKRKLSKSKTPDSDLSKKKKRRGSSDTTTSLVELSSKSQSMSTQNTKQTGRSQTRCRHKKDTQHQACAESLSTDFKDSTRSSKTGKKSSKKRVGGDSDKAAGQTNGSHDSVKKESKPETGTGLDTTKEAKKLVGAHCSIAGGLYKAVEEAVAMGGRAFGLFLRSQRSWTSKPLDPEAAEQFKASCKEHGFPPNSILPHGSYLMNCGSPNPDTSKKSREALLEELQRCEALGLTLYNFHPGSTCGEISVEECLDKIADAINWAHQHTKFVITVVENMSCQGHTVGGRFEEVKGIIDRVKDKSRMGVCLDTCHAFAAGYDLASEQGFDKFVSDFDSIVGFQYLKAMHLNDSKGAVGCHLDRHENIGKGKIGLDGFRRIMAEPHFNGIPMILETPLGDYAAEIKTLNNLIE